jgi:hypothetical protein
MAQRIRAFGGETTSRFSITDGEEISMTLRRVVWFDQDIDGRWLVWATSEDAVSGETAQREPPRPGAIVVKDPKIGGFIEMLGELLAHPERFEDEPVL